jgi:hypothetical protein
MRGKNPAKLRLKPTSSQKNNLQRIEKPNGLDQLGLPCRRPGFFNPLEKLALFVKVFGAQNLSQLKKLSFWKNLFGIYNYLLL